MSDLEKGYDDSQIPILRTIPIKEEPTHDLKASITVVVAAFAKNQEKDISSPTPRRNTKANE